jgi:hypothetical protein
VVKCKVLHLTMPSIAQALTVLMRFTTLCHSLPATFKQSMALVD